MSFKIKYYEKEQVEYLVVYQSGPEAVFIYEMNEEREISVCLNQFHGYQETEMLSNEDMKTNIGYNYEELNEQIIQKQQEGEEILKQVGRLAWENR